MQTSFTTDFIYDRIKDSGYPCWALGMSTGFRNVSNVMSYYGNDWTEEDNEDTKIEKSINRLAATIESCPKDAVFVIEIKAARNATGSGILGPFQFTNPTPTPEAASSEPETETKEKATTPQSPYSLGYIPGDYVPKSLLDGLEDRMQQRYAADLRALEQKMKAEQVERDYKLREERLKEKEEELKDKEKEYNSTVAKAADVLLEVGKRLGSFFLGGGNAAIVPPSAAAPPAESSLGNPSDERADLIDDISEMLYRNYNLDALKVLKSNLLNISQNANVETANQRAADPDAAE